MADREPLWGEIQTVGLDHVTAVVVVALGDERLVRISLGWFPVGCRGAVGVGDTIIVDIAKKTARVEDPKLEKTP